MAISLFKVPRNKQFTYRPRYFELYEQSLVNQEAEERAERRARVLTEVNGGEVNPQVNTGRRLMKGSFSRRFERKYSQKARSAARLRTFIIFAILCAIIYLVFMR